METRAQSFAEWKEGRSTGHGITSGYPGWAGLVVEAEHRSRNSLTHFTVTAQHRTTAQCSTATEQQGWVV